VPVSVLAPDMALMVLVTALVASRRCRKPARARRLNRENPNPKTAMNLKALALMALLAALF
jgi:hypothetical protein